VANIVCNNQSLVLHTATLLPGIWDRYRQIAGRDRFISICCSSLLM